MVGGRKVRAAVIGLGRHGLRHIEAYKQIDADVVALCDLRSESVSSALIENPGANGYTSWQELLNNEQLDVISVVTNGPSHAPITIAASEAGVRHILCEKPLATSVDDGLKMIAACEKHAVRLSVCHARRWVSSYKKLRDLIAEGIIGDLCHFSFICGGGLFAGNGTHFMDLARMLSGANPVSVTAIIDQKGTPNPRGAEFKDPGAVALYQFDNGMRLIVDMFEDLGVPPQIEIVGSIGRVSIDEINCHWSILARQGKDRERPVGEYWLPLVPQEFEGERLDMIAMMAEGLTELLGEGEITCTGTDGLATLEMVIAAHASGRNGGSQVHFPLSDETRTLDIPLT